MTAVIENHQVVGGGFLFQAFYGCFHFVQRLIFAEADFKPQLFQHVLGPLTANWDVTTDMASLRVPILIAHGRYDYVSPYTMWNGIVEALGEFGPTARGVAVVNDSPIPNSSG